jgi:hypothetical protein
LPDSGSVTNRPPPSLADIRQKRPRIKRALLKLNASFSGEGNARFDFPESTSRGALRDALQQLHLTSASESTDTFFDKFERGGGVAEEMIEAAQISSPSVQVRINPRREVILASTHEQILGGRDGQIFLGCLFPAYDDYRREIQDLGRRVGHALAEKDVIGRFSIDFLASRNAPDEPWNISTIEINLRMGGTIHPHAGIAISHRR